MKKVKKLFTEDVDMRKRVKSKIWWMEMISGMILVISTIAKLAGVDIDFIAIEESALDIIRAVSAILLTLGFSIDTSTPGIKDNPESKG